MKISGRPMIGWNNNLFVRKYVIALGSASAIAFWIASSAVRAGADNASCSLSSNPNLSGNTVTCNFGLTPEQLKELTEAAVKGANEPLTHQIVEISRTLSVTEDAAKSLLKIVGEDPNFSEDRLAEALTKAAADYKRLQAQLAALNPDNPSARALVEQAKTEIDTGHFDRAHELLRQATQAQIAAAQQVSKLREQAVAALDAQMLGAASSTAVEGDVALTERHYKEAAELFGQAADYVPNGHPDERNSYVSREAFAFYKQGYDLGDNDALRNAVQLYRIALQGQIRQQVPLDWAKTQASLGRTLAALGEREIGTARLEEAVAAFRAALGEETRERTPLDWAATQTDLGDALVSLGTRESGTARLEEAVSAYRAALGEETRERVPLQWAMTLNSLGVALMRLGERESGTDKLQQAVQAFRAALQELTRDRVPLQWAMTQTNLGNALTRLGERESGTDKLQLAVAAYRGALQELTRERVPLEWAQTQNNLGSALQTLGERESGAARFEEAVAAYRAALEENTRERVPLEWARTQMNLGNALHALGERESGTDKLQLAVAAYRAALEELTRDRVPLYWAATTGDQGAAQITIADRTNDAALADTAVREIQAATEAARSGGDEWGAAKLQAQLPKAQAIRDRLKDK
jgi:tetratricopeptide (TPR) repeat protein